MTLDDRQKATLAKIRKAAELLGVDLSETYVSIAIKANGGAK